ncbi:hypothetical protein HC928_23430, partial [bacterium]|nr:hypothetical protein [bacterium]
QALRTTLDQGFGYNHSICHGDLGNLDLLNHYKSISAGSSECGRHYSSWVADSGRYGGSLGVWYADRC